MALTASESGRFCSLSPHLIGPLSAHAGDAVPDAPRHLRLSIRRLLRGGGGRRRDRGGPPAGADRAPDGLSVAGRGRADGVRELRELQAAEGGRALLPQPPRGRAGVTTSCTAISLTCC
eukprot:32221-Prorocentrum_minimum.AAC.1